MTDNFDSTLARIAVSAYDDAQDVRKSMMNRVRDVIRKRNEGIKFNETETTGSGDVYDSKYNDENLGEIVEEMVESEKLTQREYEYISMMLEAANTAASIEDQYQKVMEICADEPIYTEWLEDVYGVSYTLTARLLHAIGYCAPARVVKRGDVIDGTLELYDEREVIYDESLDGHDGSVDFFRSAVQKNREARDVGANDPYFLDGFPRVSNLWSYCGLAPGQGATKGERLTYNPDAKTLAWLVADRMIMQGSNSNYKTEFYDPYKQKQVDRMKNSECKFCGQTAEDHSQGSCDSYDGERDFDLWAFELPDSAPEDATPAWSLGHADARARRYLSKKFLKHYWVIARDLKGFETPDEYILTQGGHEKRTDTFEDPFYAKRKIKSQ